MRLGSGDLVVAHGPAPYTFADEPDTVPAGRVPTRRRAQLPDGRPLNSPMGLGIRTWDDLPEAGTAVLIGMYPGAL